MCADLEALEDSCSRAGSTDSVALFVMPFCDNRVPSGGGAGAFDASVIGWGPMHVAHIGVLHATMHRTHMADLHGTPSGCLLSVQWLGPWSVSCTGPGCVGHALGRFVGEWWPPTRSWSMGNRAARTEHHPRRRCGCGASVPGTRTRFSRRRGRSQTPVFGM